MDDEHWQRVGDKRGEADMGAAGPQTRNFNPPITDRGTVAENSASYPSWIKPLPDHQRLRMLHCGSEVVRRLHRSKLLRSTAAAVAFGIHRLPPSLCGWFSCPNARFTAISMAVLQFRCMTLVVMAGTMLSTSITAVNAQWLSAGMSPKGGWRRGLSVHYGASSGAGGGRDSSGMNPNINACGLGLSGASARFFTAVSDVSSFGMRCGGGPRPSCGGPACGRCIAVTCVAKLRGNMWSRIFSEDMGRNSLCIGGPRSKAVVLRITDACPSSHWNNRRKGGANICGQRQVDVIDMSSYAFNILTRGNPGQIHMEWRWASCSQLGEWRTSAVSGSLVQRLSA
eukprot:jgi/Mesvir1/20831/Mv26438-RA.1